MTTETNEQIFAECLDFMGSQSVMSLATSKDNKPWVSDLLYVIDEDGRLYFLSSPLSRHVENLEMNARVSISIHAPYIDWCSIKGVQCEGEVIELDQVSKEQAEKLYYDRYADIAQLLKNPQTEQEQKISDAYKKTRFYQVKPFFMRLIDNQSGFASRREWNGQI
jgi:uncharacterized protein YhbP (UPF0306 family)